MEDKTAISRLKQGDLNGLETLVRRYQVRAVHAAFLILQDRSLAEEVVQTAFLKAADRIHQFDGERQFSPWFFRIVVNDSLKVAKRRQRHISLEEQLEEPDAKLAQWLVHPNPLPEQLVEAEEARQHILTAIRALPPGQRAAIVMRYFLEMSMADMTANTGRPLSTIKWWLRDARQRLRRLLETPEVAKE